MYTATASPPLSEPPRNLPTAQVASRHITQWSLNNGVQCASWYDERDTVATMQLWLRVGSAWERTGETGLAHMLEHMMFRGTRTVPDGEFDARMEDLGASCNAMTWLDYTAYMATCSPDVLSEVMALERDRLESLVIDPTAFAAERDVVANERRQVVDGDPDSQIHELLQRMAFGAGTPYGWPTIGWHRDIERYSARKLRRFYEQNYAPSRLCVVVVGPVAPEEVSRLVDRHFSNFHREVPLAPEQLPSYRPAARRRMRLAMSAPRLMMAWPSPGATDPELPVWHMLADVLGGGDASRLPTRLEVQDSIASEASASAASHANPHLFDIQVRLLPGESATHAERLVMEELRRLAAEGPTEQELARKRLRVEVEDATTLMSTWGRADWMGSSWISHGDVRRAFTWADEVAAVTAQQVQSLARRLAVQCPWVLHALPEAPPTRRSGGGRSGRPDAGGNA